MNMKTRFSLILSTILIILIIALTIKNNGITLNNANISKTGMVENEIVSYGTDYVYSDNMSKTADPIVIKDGINGLSFTYDGLNYQKISDSKNQVLQVGTAKTGDYSGRLTGYGPDCPGCSKVGNVACKTKEGTNHSLISDGLYYTDITYGKLRILAADNTAFPCGTVVKVDNGTLDVFYGIVLDSGSSMRNAWKEGTVWMDLAFSSQKVARTGGATSSNTKFNVQRWGW